MMMPLRAAQFIFRAARTGGEVQLDNQADGQSRAFAYSPSSIRGFVVKDREDGNGKNAMQAGPTSSDAQRCSAAQRSALGSPQSITQGRPPHSSLCSVPSLPANGNASGPAFGSGSCTVEHGPDQPHKASPSLTLIELKADFGNPSTKHTKPQPPRPLFIRVSPAATPTHPLVSSCIKTQNQRPKCQKTSSPPASSATCAPAWSAP